MNIFDVLEMLGGLCLFLFGMSIMGDGLERRAGNSLRTLLSKITTNKFAGFFTGMGVTCIQETWVQPLIRKDPTCQGATKPVHHNY